MKLSVAADYLKADISLEFYFIQFLLVFKNVESLQYILTYCIFNKCIASQVNES